MSTGVCGVWEATRRPGCDPVDRPAFQVGWGTCFAICEQRSPIVLSEGRCLSDERAQGVEAQLRARAELLKARAEPPRVPPTALGCCAVCGQFVVSGDRLAMSGGHLRHADCT